MLTSDRYELRAYRAQIDHQAQNIRRLLAGERLTGDELAVLDKIVQQRTRGQLSIDKLVLLPEERQRAFWFSAKYGVLSDGEIAAIAGGLSVCLPGARR